MGYFKISLAGDLGSGKSTVTEILKSRYDVQVVSMGKLFREVAEEKNMTPVEFNVFLETHPEYDHEFDRRLHLYDEKQGNYIFDSRLAFHFVPSAVSYYLKVDLTESAKRVMNAMRQDEKYESIEQAKQKLSERRNSEIVRYKDFYGVDITDMSNYDCVIDTTNSSPEEVAEKIIDFYNNFHK